MDGVEMAKYNQNFALPLANFKNRQLQQQVQEKREKLEKMMADINNNRNNININQQQLAASQLNQQQTHNLSRNVRNQARKEADATKLVTNETSVIEQQIDKLQRYLNLRASNRQSQNERLSNEEKQLNRLNEIFESEAKVVETMEKMSDEQQQDQDILQKYSSEDDHIIKELEVKLAKSRESAAETKRRYEAAKSERETTAIQLQSIQQEFRTILHNRNQSLQRWQATLDQIDQCRQKLQLHHHQLRISKELSAQDAAKSAALDQSINQVNSDVASLQATFQRRQIFAAQLNTKCEQLQRITDENEAELASAEKELQRHLAELDAARQRAATLRALIDTVKTQLDDEKEQHATLQQQLQHIETDVGTSNEKNQALNQLFKAVENRLATKHRLLNEMDNDRVKIEAELNQLQSEMNGCKTEMGLNSSNSQLNKKTIHQCNNQIQLQEEVIYQKNMEQLRADLELKKLRGNADAPDQRRNLRLEIETLKKNLDSNSVHLVALKYQLSKTQSESKGLERCCDGQQQRTSLMQKVSIELQSECRSYEKECQDVRSDVEDIRLKDSLMRLELRRRQHLFQTQRDAVHNLQNEKKTIENIIEHRLEELRNETELLQVEFRSLSDRNQQLLLNVKHKQSEIDRIKIRYDQVAFSLTSESDQPEDNSEAYFIIKMAQEKEMLKESITSLSDAVMELKVDNAALINTLTLVTSANQQFRQHTIVGVMPESDEMVKQRMEKENDELERTLKTLKKQARIMQTHHKELDEQVTGLTAELFAINGTIDDKSVEDKQTAEDVDTIQLRIGRAKNMAADYQKRARKVRKTSAKLIEEMEFDVIQMHDDWIEVKNSVQKLISDDADASAFFRFPMQSDETQHGISANGRDATELKHKTGSKMDLNIARFVTRILQNDVRGRTTPAVAHQN